MKFIRDILIGALCYIALFVAVTRPTGAVEIPVHVIDHHDGVKMRLLNAPCVDTVSLGIITQAPAQFQGRFKAIASEWRAKDGSWGDFAGCWLLVPAAEVGAPDDIFILIFADGAVVQVFKNELLPKKNGV